MLEPILVMAMGLATNLTAPSGSKPSRAAPAPPLRVAVPTVKRRPLLSNPQLTYDAKRVFIARTERASGELTGGLDVFVVPLVSDQKAETIHFPILGGLLSLMLSRNQKYLAVLAQGELWLKALGDETPPQRLYPPAEGDAPLGATLSQAAFAGDSTWLLVQSTTGWGRLGLSGQFGGLSLKPIDLSSGSIALSPDGSHVAVTRSQRGQGYLNGGHVIVINLSTDFAQGLDIDHLYTEVLFLPDGPVVGKDVDGTLWVLQPRGRIPYFKPPPAPAGSTIEGYSINLAATKLAWTVTFDSNENKRSAELWVGSAPPTPQPAKPQGEGEK